MINSMNKSQKVEMISIKSWATCEQKDSNCVKNFRFFVKLSSNNHITVLPFAQTTFNPWLQETYQALQFEF